eukprot:5706793-Amphidinium_carterae.2
MQIPQCCDGQSASHAPFKARFCRAKACFIYSKTTSLRTFHALPASTPMKRRKYSPTESHSRTYSLDCSLSVKGFLQSLNSFTKAVQMTGAQTRSMSRRPSQPGRRSSRAP